MSDTVNPQFTEDERILLGVFPAEVWNMILSSCDSNSIIQLSNSSHCFQNWILPYKTAYLFPGVWEIVKDHYLNLHLPAYWPRNWSPRKNHKTPAQLQNQLKPLIQEQLSQDDELMRLRRQQEYDGERYYQRQRDKCTLQNGLRSALNFRLVCKHWRRAVNTTYLKELENQRMDMNRVLENEAAGSLIPYIETKINFRFNFEKFDQIISNPVCFTDNQFIGRALVIENWNNKTVNLLKRIGERVWYCSMVVNSGFPSKDVAYSDIKNALKLLPNLKFLEIVDVWKKEYFVRNQESEAMLTEQLLKTVSSKPIQKLTKLQVLKTKNLSFPIFNELIRSNGHAKTLVVNRDINCGEYNIYTEPLPELEKLSLQILKDSDLEELSSQCVDWRLAKLHLCVETRNAFNWNKLFELFREKWKHTRITLRYFGHEWEGIGKEFSPIEF